MRWFCWNFYYWKRCFLRGVTAILLQQKNFGPNVIYFALGITEGLPAGAFWADKIITQGGVTSWRRPVDITGGVEPRRGNPVCFPIGVFQLLNFWFFEFFIIESLYFPLKEFLIFWFFHFWICFFHFSFFIFDLIFHFSFFIFELIFHFSFLICWYWPPSRLSPPF